MNRGSQAYLATFLRQWALVTLAAASMITAADALLLQRSRGLFTGGFLSTDHLQGGAAMAGFVVLSLLIDAAVAGLLASVAMYVLGRWRVRTPAVIAGGFLAAVGPLVAAQILEFQLVRFLGTGFDLALMFDLTGRSVGEMLAVSAQHLLVPALVGLAATAVAAGVIWAINKAPAAAFTAPPLRVLLTPALLLVGACVALATAVSFSESLENGLLRKPSGQALRLIVAGATDVDRDGFGLIGALPDPDPFDGRVFPYAADIPGNGVDEDGLAGDLPVDAPRYAETAVSAAPWLRTPDVVLFGLESFRADLVGATHDGKPVTPAMDALAAQGLSSRQAFSHNGYTVQSRFHLFSGTLTAGEGTRTLVDDFIAKGYVVGYFSGQDESFGSDEYRVGFDRAHAASDARADMARRYTTFATPGSLAVPAQVVQERIETRGRCSCTSASRTPIFRTRTRESTRSSRTFVFPESRSRPRRGKRSGQPTRTRRPTLTAPLDWSWSAWSRCAVRPLRWSSRPITARACSTTAFSDMVMASTTCKPACHSSSRICRCGCPTRSVTSTCAARSTRR
jgi:hypothetical protein